MKAYVHLLEYYGLVITHHIVMFFPPKIIYRVGCLLGFVVFHIIRIRRKQVLENLKTAFPGKDQKWFNRVARETYQHTAVAMLEFLKMPKFDRKYIEKRIQISGLENLDRALKKGKGVIVAGGHFGNWEYNGTVFPVLGYPTSFVMVEQHNLLVHSFTNKFRKEKGINCISTRTGTREIIRRLRMNQLVCMLYDQNAGKNGIMINFFNNPASTHAGLAQLARKTGAALVTSFMGRTKEDSFQMFINEPVWADPRMEKMESITTMTNILNSQLEEMITQYPSHWFWYHRRWKKQPQ